MNEVGDRAADAETVKRFPTVGIGTSAGGVHALQMFFESLPDNVDAAFVVVVHLDPEHQSELSNILAARTRMPVAQVSGRVRLEPRRVYVIPPNRQLVTFVDIGERCRVEEALRESESRMRVLVGELQHRTRNFSAW